MGHRYTLEQLQSLRSSPLVQKPVSLPPADEWMGVQTEQGSKRVTTSKAKFDGVIDRNEPGSRPVDGRHYSKTGAQAPGDIVLGPPKSSFASASTPRGTIGESHGRSAFGSFGVETRGDFFAKGRMGGERLRLDQQDDKPRYGTGRSGRDEEVPWSGRPTNHSSTADERTNYSTHTRDLEKESGDYPRRIHNRSSDSFRREGGRDVEEGRRGHANHSSRPSWYRDDEVNDVNVRDGNGNSRSRGWREGGRLNRGTSERDNHRSMVSHEQEPEWMEDFKTTQKKEKHNAQDIEKWKASMKAMDSAEAKVGEQPPTLPSAPHSRTVSGPLQLQPKKEVPLSVDPGMDDKFLSFFDNPSAEPQPSIQKVTEDSAKSRTVRTQKSSKFTDFFGPVAPAPLHSPEGEAASSTPNLDTSVDPVNEDKAGFQRILQMLGAPHPSSRTPAAHQEPLRTSEAFVADGRGSAFVTNSPPPILSPRSRKAHDIENLLGMQSPKEANVSINKDSEFLLNLLRSKGHGHEQMPRAEQNMPRNEIEPRQTDNFFPSQRGLPIRQPEMQHQQSQFFDEQDFSQFGGKDPRPPHGSRNPSENLGFEDMDDGSVFPPQFSMMAAHHPPPSGLQRPPGFEQPAPPPQFQQFMHHPQRGGVPPPPGFGPHSTRNHSQPPFPPGLVPGVGNMHLNERGPSFNGRSMGPMTGVPPPGLMSLNGPPPGFPIGPGSDHFLGNGRPPAEFGDAGGSRGLAGHYRRQEQ